MLNRRDFIALSSLSFLPEISAASELDQSMLKRIIPSSGEEIPVIGLGTSRVFDIVPSQNEINIRREILDIFYENGGRLIDTSPMYGMSEEIIGISAEDYIQKNRFFLATKVWTEGKENGLRQIEESFQKMKANKISLIQVHNLLDWKTQIKTLRSLKDEGRIDYIGITHYKSNAFDEMIKIMEAERIDFAQFNYSLGERDAEQRILPFCKDNGIATLINRPFMRGRLFKEAEKKRLPSWVSDYGIDSWGQLFLKYIIADDAVTNVIPATSKSKNMLDNSKAGMGEMLDAAAKKRVLEVF
ncbi:MAG TPA: aldo/keto reductase [Gammaproteobacteria bacterium]|jgi:diketogulonate reductase-like aldo/keto reductase|nr:aldo/keto reductase [Gammaproteobacteria bacterium]HJM09285.1 aldo/keto reductase [Gammaproteobacteria bacterium]HJM99931.1 aldo/keto reductase [Gammaproteobacteria bacterium]|tara:strand:- start:34903 stop:35802 length:900 start_codon:yes stop_codon:yes gene_type:complete